MKRICIVFAVVALVGCQQMQRPSAASTQTVSPLRGEFDNHEQVWLAHEAAQGTVMPPHVVVSIEPTPQAEWSIWHIRLDATPPLEATWTIQTVTQADGSTVLVPARALVATPTSTFDPKQWAALDGCALRNPAKSIGLRVAADIASCAAIAPGIGPSAALLPIGIEREGEWLHIRLYADQARGADAREDAREVHWFGGWAAINGGGPKADAASRDWHMDRTLRIGSEGGRYALKWRDGNASGYSLELERLTYREGNVPVLKLSIVQDADGHTLAYSWANPEATSIGLNLGWVQVGLQRAGNKQ